MMSPNPQLVALLEKHDIDWETFSKQGRPAPGVRDKRVAIVTDLHSSGLSWADMMTITGLSNGGIQRLTGAMWNPASRVRLRTNMKKVGASWKGKKRPGQLEAMWAAGVFDVLRGRVRSDVERSHLKAGWTPEKRSQMADRSKALWEDPTVRDRILTFHRSPEERARRSAAQTLRLAQDPGKWAKGKSRWINTPKGVAPKAHVRSSYEAATIFVLESDPNVVAYQFEPRFILPDGHWILPDFLVWTTQRILLIEVKASWVFGLPPDDRVHLRLNMARKVAADHGWDFAIWTEQKELTDALKHPS